MKTAEHLAQNPIIRWLVGWNSNPFGGTLLDRTFTHTMNRIIHFCILFYVRRQLPSSYPFPLTKIKMRKYKRSLHQSIYLFLLVHLDIQGSMAKVGGCPTITHLASQDILP